MQRPTTAAANNHFLTQQGGMQIGGNASSATMDLLCPSGQAFPHTAPPELSGTVPLWGVQEATGPEVPQTLLLLCFIVRAPRSQFYKFS